MSSHSYRHMDETWGVGNIVPVLEHGDRTCEVDIFDIPSLQKCDAAAISGAEKLPLESNDKTAPIVP
jgi:hypothetical protein